MITIAVDVMGGDFGISVTIPALTKFLHQFPQAKLILVGDENAIQKALEQEKVAWDKIQIQHATEVVGMDESPQSALKNKKDSSMRVTINQVKEGNAQAAVSAGNTGALMATARFVLKTIAGIDRPAIAKFLPTKNNDVVCALDLGANIDCSADQINQFAILGSHLVSALHPHKKNPRIGLLNVGSEEIKGTTVVKEVYSLLQKGPLNFLGNIEGDDILSGDMDVLVCDGFIGNIVLKTIEGSVGFVGGLIKKEFTASVYAKIVALLTLPIFKKFKANLDPRKYNGAIFLGLKGVVVKSHGGTDVEGFYYALAEAYHEVESDYLAHLEQNVLHDLSKIEAQNNQLNFK